jgi:putative effector of murein hydrolase
MIWLAIFLSQILFNILKVLEIRYTYENNTNKLLLNSVWMALASLASMFWSLDELMKGNWAVIPIYVLGNLVGKYVGMSVDTDKKHPFSLL